MSLEFTIDVVGPGDRTVHLRCHGLSPVAYRGPAVADSDEVTLTAADVLSRSDLDAFLAEAARPAADGGTVVVNGLDDDMRAVLRLLDVVGPPPDPIVHAAVTR